MTTDALAHRIAGLRSRLAGLPQDEREDLLPELEAILEALGPEGQSLLRENGERPARRELPHPERFSPLILPELLPDAFVATDLGGKIRWANAAAATWLNTPPRSLVGRSVLRFLVPEARAAFNTEIAPRLEVDPAHHWEAGLQPRGGAPVDAAVTLMVEWDAAGRSIGLQWLFRDITESKRSEGALQFLVQAGQALAARVDYEATLVAVARLALTTFADCCGVYLTGEGTPLRQLILAHPDAATEAHLRELNQRHPPDPEAPIGVPKAIRTSRPELVAEVSNAFLSRHAEHGVHLGLLPELGFRSYLVVPVRTRRKTWGAMSYCRKSSGPPFGPDELAVAEHVAFLAALIMDRAGLYQKLRLLERPAEAGLSQPSLRTHGRRQRS